jgi:hypothetical protein
MLQAASFTIFFDKPITKRGGYENSVTKIIFGNGYQKIGNGYQNLVTVTKKH